MSWQFWADPFQKTPYYFSLSHLHSHYPFCLECSALLSFIWLLPVQPFTASSGTCSSGKTFSHSPFLGYLSAPRAPLSTRHKSVTSLFVCCCFVPPWNRKSLKNKDYFHTWCSSCQIVCIHWILCVCVYLYVCVHMYTHTHHHRVEQNPTEYVNNILLRIEWLLLVNFMFKGS